MTNLKPSSSSPIEIRFVRSRRDRHKFALMPREIYRDDPQWVSPLLSEVKASIDPKKHPFYLHGQAQAILALRDGKPVGRILVSDDPLYNKEHDSNVGMFGMFESIDDKQVSDALLEAAADWLRERGRSSILGPIDYSTNYPVGLLIDGFDTPQRVMMNHHRPYYRPLLESWGLRKPKTYTLGGSTTRTTWSPCGVNGPSVS